MMRVLIVEASSGGVVGGSLTGLYHLVRGMNREQFAVSMVLYEPKHIEADLRQIGVPVHHVSRQRLSKQHALLGSQIYERARRVGAVRGAFRSVRQMLRLAVEELPAAARLAAVIRREQPDVVHLGNGVRANFDGILACLFRRVPVVCHVKGFEKYSARERWASRRTDSIVCMTQAILAYCIERGVRGRDSRVIYDAVDEAWLQPSRSVGAVKGELGIPASAPCVGVVGNVQEWKGQHVFVEAFASVAGRHRELHGLIVGGTHRAGESYAEGLRERINALGLGGRIHFLGFREDVVDVMNALDIVVHTSVRPEPFGRVILEGMLLGKPVIATHAGGVPELIEHGKTGFLVQPGDEDQLVNQLDMLLSDPTAGRQVGERAQAWAHERFSLRRHVEEMTRVYERAAGKR